MADVRLTATNPEDSSVVPVACNAKGELLLEEPQGFDGNVDGDLTVSGSASFAGGNINLASPGYIRAYRPSNLPGSGVIQAASDIGGVNNNVFQVETDGKVMIGGTLPSSPKISLDADGSATFKGSVSFGTAQTSGFTSNGQVHVEHSNATTSNDYIARFWSNYNGRSEKAVVYTDGSASFASDVVIGSRGKKWMIVESNGLAHLVEQTRAAEMQETTYPALRDIPGELTMVEQQLQKVLEKLRMIPEAGWEVWDGSDTN